MLTPWMVTAHSSNVVRPYQPTGQIVVPFPLAVVRTPKAVSDRIASRISGRAHAELPRQVISSGQHVAGLEIIVLDMLDDGASDLVSQCGLHQPPRLREFSHRLAFLSAIHALPIE